ncbi:MAG: CoA-binding protein [Gemmatimonadota bacterium]
MTKIEVVRHMIAGSSDVDNPSAEEIVEVLRSAQHVAVIGLSRHPQKAARRVPSYLLAKGYDVIPVNPNADRILGRQAYPALEDVPDPVDLVVIFRPSAEAGPFVDAAASRESQPAIWLQTGIRADEEARAARAAGRFVVQDLCIFRVHRILVD